MSITRIKSDTLVQGYIEIMPNGGVNIHLFDTLDFAYDDAKEIRFEKFIYYKIDPEHPPEDEADISTCYSLTRESFIEELKTLNITVLNFNAKPIDKENLVLY